MRLVLLGVAVALATLRPAAAEPDQDPLTAPVEPPLAQPWRIGHWATYRHKTATGGEGLVTIKLVAEDGCGLWVELDVDDDQGRTVTARTCIGTQTAPNLQADRVTILRREGTTVSVGDSDDAAGVQLLNRLLRVDWAGRKGLPREDITTQKGVTILTIKETPVDGDPNHTRWSHPALPLGGLVREVIGGDELLLIEQGVTPDTSVIASDNQRLVSASQAASALDRPRKKWMTFSFGTDLLGTLDEANWSETFGFTLGYKFSPRLALALNSTQTGLAPFPEIPELAEQLTYVTLGVRWYPYQGPPRSRWSFLAQGVYTQLDAGYAHLTRGRLLMESSIVGRGGAAGLRIGYSTGIAHDWKLALEVHEHTALLNSDEDIRVTLGLHAIVELYLP